MIIIIKAVLYHKMKKYDKVQYMYETVLEKHKIIYGLDDLITLQTMENLAAAFMHQNETKKAEPLFSFVLGNNHILYFILMIIVKMILI